MTEQRLLDSIPAQFAVEERFGAGGQLRQNRLQPGHQHAEHIQAHGADGLQIGVAAFLFGDHPRRLLVNVAVCHVGQRHDFADGFPELAAVPRIANACCRIGEGFIQLRIGQLGGQHTVETLVDETGVTRGKVNHLVDDIGVDALHEVFQVQVDIIDT